MTEHNDFFYEKEGGTKGAFLRPCIISLACQNMLSRDQGQDLPKGWTLFGRLALKTKSYCVLLLYYTHRSAGHRLYDVGHDGDRDEEPGDVVKDEGGRGGVWDLEGAPHALAQLLGLDAVAALLVVQLVV